MPACVVCKKKVDLSVCAGCKGVHYCGAEHQKEDWKRHKEHCKSAKACLTEGFVKKVTKEGDGPLAKGNVKVHYTGWLLDGSQFDSSRGGSPFSFPLGKRQVITGWDKGVATMKVGERAVFVLSPEYGYGAEGAPPDIPGNSVLVFDVEVLSCN